MPPPPGSKRSLNVRILCVWRTVSASLGVGVTDQILQPWLGAVMGKLDKAASGKTAKRPVARAKGKK